MAFRPHLSIVMPCRDAAETLTECLTSIEAQTIDEWELVAIDDGSTDRSAEILRSRSTRDPRIRLLSPGRIGLVAALNLGISEAGAPLIARMDADDTMEPERLELQCRHLDANPSLALVACQVRLFPEREVRDGYREYIRWQNACLTTEDISSEIYVESPFAHPSVMFRRDVVIDAGGYRDGEFPEDYELWLRLNEIGASMEKIPRVLLDWRESSTRFSRVDTRYSRDAFDRIRAQYLARDQRLRGSRPLAFCGAGRRTRRRMQHLLSLGVSPDAYVDVDPGKIGRPIEGVEVHPVEWLEQEPRPFVLVWVSSHGARDLIATRLGELGYQRGRDWLGVG